MITIPDIPDGYIVSVKEFFKFRRVFFRKAAKQYTCDECQGPIEQSKSPRARKYLYMAWAPKDPSYPTPSGKHTETWRICPDCMVMWRGLTSKVRNLDEVNYTFLPGKLLELGEVVYKLIDDLPQNKNKVT